MISDSVKDSTIVVLSNIPDNELNIITLPILRQKVSEVMNLSDEELRGKEIKMLILKTFQEFLIKKDKNKTIDELKYIKKIDGNKECREMIIDLSPAPKQSKLSAKAKKSDYIKKVKVESNLKDYKSFIDSSLPTSLKSKALTKSPQIEKLKSYVYKCGVRKNWKKELAELSDNQCIKKLHEILKEIGIEGQPNLEKCKIIKKRREFEAELKEIDASNIIYEKRRKGNDALIFKKSTRKQIIDSEESFMSSSENEIDNNVNENILNLKDFGDSESD